MNFQKLVLLLTLTCLSVSIFASSFATIKLQSTHNKTHLLQLYTSEGCSSCPPADQWLSSQINNPGLFKDFIPMAFHVDYWDYIGWNDPFAKAAFSERQRLLKSQNIIKSVYTPGIVYANFEFRQWFKGDRDLSFNFADQSESADVLTVEIDGTKLMVDFDSNESNLKVNVAYLKMNQFSHVKSGENHGKQFTHDFVVAELIQFDYKKGKINDLSFLNETQNAAISIWITKGNRLENLQAVGGMLSDVF